MIRVHRKHGIEHDGQFGFEPAGETFREIAEGVGLFGDPPRPEQERASRLGQGRAVSGAIEQRHVDLRFELLNPIGHRGLGAVQLLRRFRETALINDSEEDVDLVEGERVEIPILDRSR